MCFILCNFLGRFFRACHQDDKANSLDFKRCIVNYFYGVIMALILWHLMLLNICFSMEANFIILVVLSVVLGVGFVFTNSVKCLTLLILAGMLNKSGRSYLRAMSFAYVISGPIANLASNGGEIVRVFACATTLTYNLTKTRLDLMTRPFQNTVKNMDKDVVEVQETFNNISEILEPIRHEIEDEDDPLPRFRHRRAELDSDEVQKHYEKKFENRCKGQLAKGAERCRVAFSNAHEKCEEKFPIIVRQLLCWPFHIDFLCDMNILGDPDELCNPKDALPDSFGESYKELVDTKEELMSHGAVNITYKIQSDVAEKAKERAEVTAERVMTEFQTRKRVFDSVMKVMEIVLYFFFLRVLISAFSYYIKYRRKIDYDNIYISDYFRHVDERRKKCHKRTLLPLKKFENKTLVDLSNSCQRTREEKRTMIFYMVQYLLEIMAGSFFFLFDHLIVSLLRIVREKSLIEYVQEGEHVIHFHVNGTGLLARLLRRTLHNFNMNEHVSTYLSNEVCLPRPSVLSQSFYIKLAIIYALVILLICKSTFFLRLRRAICAQFNRRHEKKRILYLYNTMLRRRRGMFEIMLKIAEENQAKQQINRDTNFLLKLRCGYPMFFSWLRFFERARYKCLICGETKDYNFMFCTNENCAMPYCPECFEDLGDVCIACKQPFLYMREVVF